MVGLLGVGRADKLVFHIAHAVCKGGEITEYDIAVGIRLYILQGRYVRPLGLTRRRTVYDDGRRTVFYRHVVLLGGYGINRQIVGERRFLFFALQFDDVVLGVTDKGVEHLHFCISACGQRAEGNGELLVVQNATLGAVRAEGVGLIQIFFFGAGIRCRVVLLVDDIAGCVAVPLVIFVKIIRLDFVIVTLIAIRGLAHLFGNGGVAGDGLARRNRAQIFRAACRVEEHFRFYFVFLRKAFAVYRKGDVDG